MKKSNDFKIIIQVNLKHKWITKSVNYEEYREYKRMNLVKILDVLAEEDLDLDIN